VVEFEIDRRVTEAPVACCVVQSNRRLVQTLFLTTGLLAATYGAMFATLAEFRDDYGISTSGISLIVAVGFFTSFAVQLTLAPLADRGHARRLVVIGVLITIAGTLGMAAFRTLTPLLISRIAMGIGAGLSTPALRRIFILLDPTAMGANLGKLLATDVAGFVVGPIIGALTVDKFGVAAPFLILAAGLALCLPLLMRVHVQEGTNDGPRSERFAVDLLANRGVLSATLLGVAIFVMIGTFDSLWVLVMTDMNATSFIAKSGIVVFALPLIVLGSLGGRLTQKLGPFRAGTFGLLFGTCCMLLYGNLPNPYTMIGVGVVHGINDGLTITGTGVAVGMNVPQHRQGAAQGLLGGMQTLAGGLAALAAGPLYEHTSRQIVFAICALTMLALIASSFAMSHLGGFFRSVPPGPGSVVPAVPAVVA
jgi:MFS family permease